MPRVELELRAQIANLNTRLEQTEKQLKDIGKQSDKTSKTIQQNMSKTDSVVQKFGNTLKAVLSIGAVVQFTRAMVNVRKEFEKYQAVLSNTLGSQREANKEFSMLREFARTTPFQLRELTESYVKLVNYGLKPTREQLRQLGDIASSLGKSFDQLTEALADAITGEFERLKEFGIRASKEGDKVIFTFKEVKTQVDFTADAIKRYILSLGDLEGVQGSMESQIKTLGVGISNLQGAWDELLNTLGTRSEGIFKNVIAYLTELIEKMEIAMTEFKPMDEAANYLDQFKKSIKDLDDEAKKTATVDYIIHLKQILPGMRNEMVALSDEMLDASRKDIWGVLRETDLEKSLNNQYLALKNLTEIYPVLIPMLEKFLGEIGKTEGSGGEETPGLTEAERKKLYQARLKAYNETKALEQEEAKEFAEYEMEMLNEVANYYKDKRDESLRLEEEKNERLAMLYEERTKKDQEEIDKRVQKEREANELVKELKIQGTMEALNFVSNLNRSWYEAELAAAGDSEERKNAIRRRYALIEKANSIAKAIIYGHLAILKNTAELGTLPAVPVNQWQKIITAIQVAGMLAQRFAKGVIDLRGPGTETSDSIPAMLSRGESVMTANETKRFKPWLQSMRDNTFPVVGFEIAKALEKGMVTNNLNYDNSKEIKELRMIREELKKRSFSSTYFENGKKIIKKGNITTRISLN